MADLPSRNPAWTLACALTKIVEISAGGGREREGDAPKLARGSAL